MIQHTNTSQNAQNFAFTGYSCPIARIEAERKISPMAMLVARTTQAPTFA